MIAQALAAVMAAWFAFYSPTSSALLHERASNKDVRLILAAADRALQRAPHPLPRIHTEGTLPHQGIRDQSIEAAKDFSAILNLGLAYQLNFDARYLATSERYLRAWLDVYHASFNPIDETRFEPFILGYDLVRDRLAPDVRTKMASLMRAMALGYLDPEKGPTKGSNRVNNWQSHRIKLITLAAFSLGEPALIERARAAYVKQLALNFKPDGSVIDFEERDALHYVAYDLEPLTLTVLAAREHGQDWYAIRNPAGVSLQEALEWLRPYCDGTKTHQEFVHSKVAFDAQRRAAGLSEYGGMFDRFFQCRLVFETASILDSRFRSTSKSLGPIDPWLALSFPWE